MSLQRLAAGGWNSPFSFSASNEPIQIRAGSPDQHESCFYYLRIAVCNARLFDGGLARPAYLLYVGR